jgi:hypothetical protein
VFLLQAGKSDVLGAATRAVKGTNADAANKTLQYRRKREARSLLA